MPRGEGQRTNEHHTPRNCENDGEGQRSVSRQSSRQHLKRGNSPAGLKSPPLTRKKIHALTALRETCDKHGQYGILDAKLASALQRETKTQCDVEPGRTESWARQSRDTASRRRHELVSQVGRVDDSSLRITLSLSRGTCSRGSIDMYDQTMDSSLAKNDAGEGTRKLTRDTRARNQCDVRSAEGKEEEHACSDKFT